MTYELAFDRRALKEWQKLGHTIREQFKKKLAERLENPRVPAARLHGHADRYKIKLRADATHRHGVPFASLRANCERLIACC